VESVYVGSQGSDKVSPGSRAAILGPGYADWPMLQSDHLKAGLHKVSCSHTFVSLSGYREIYERFSVPPNI